MVCVWVGNEGEREREMEVGILIVLLSAGEGEGKITSKAGYHASVVCDAYF